MEGAVSEKDCLVGLGTCNNDQSAVYSCRAIGDKDSAMIRREAEDQTKNSDGWLLLFGSTSARLEMLGFPELGRFLCSLRWEM